MPAINTGVTSGPRRRFSNGAYNPNYGMAPESRINCALCTAAALVGRTSGDVNLALQTAVPTAARWGPLESDEAFIRWWRAQATYVAQAGLTPQVLALHDQIQGMRNWLQGQLGQLQQRGTATAPVTLADAIEWMGNRDVGTRFAVYVRSIDFAGGHWLYAEHTADGVRFIDYQMDLQGGDGPPQATTMPTCGDETAGDDARAVVIG